MALEWDPITFINLVLCIIIVILACLCFKKSRHNLPLYIGAAFGLFGISHAATLARPEGAADDPAHHHKDPCLCPGHHRLVPASPEQPDPERDTQGIDDFFRAPAERDEVPGQK